MLPLSGQISINEIRLEKGLSAGNYSLKDLSTLNINPCSTLKPDGLAPYTISKFYGYNHSALCPSASPVNVSPSITPTITPSLTPSQSIGSSVSPTPSRTPSITPSITPSQSVGTPPSPSVSRTPSITPSITPTESRTPSITPSITPTTTPSLTPSQTPYIAPSISLTPTPTPSSTPPACVWVDNALGPYLTQAEAIAVCFTGGGINTVYSNGGSKRYGDSGCVFYLDPGWYKYNGLNRYFEIDVSGNISGETAC